MNLKNKSLARTLRKEIIKKLALAIVIGLFLLALPLRGGSKDNGYSQASAEWKKVEQLKKQMGLALVKSPQIGKLQVEDRVPNKEKITTPTRIKLLHSFVGGADDGANPTGYLILSGSSLYGMTYSGGANNMGTIFKMQNNGTGFTLLHEFADEWGPMDSLALSGSTLYGTTTCSSCQNEPKLFKMQTNGRGYKIVNGLCGGDYNYDSWAIDSMAISDTTIYVLEVYEWHNDWSAAIYRIPMDGTPGSMQSFYATSSSDFDGSLIISDSTLYGTIVETKFDGTKSGTIFSKPINDSSYCYEMHAIDDKGNLLLSGSTLYGMTQAGGSGKKGTIFKIETDGSGFHLLRSFAGGANDGQGPVGSLVLSGSTLYGMTQYGGTGNKGTIFKIQTDGSGFTLLHSFAGGVVDGARPRGSLLLSGSILYGVTLGGGVNDNGVVFSLTLPTITIISPNGGEKWAEGNTHDITWKTTGTTAKVNIDYTTNKGGNWTSVITNTNNDGKHTWTVPHTPSLTSLIRISDAANVAMNDTSNSVFSILINLDLHAERREVKAFSIMRQFGQISFLGGNAGNSVAQYRLLRRKGSEDFALLRTVAPSELQNNQFQMQDKYLEKDTPYTYLVEAYDTIGQLIGISSEKTI